MCQFMKALLSIHGAKRDFTAKPIHAESKTAIFRCITRKKHQKRTEVYLSYMRVAFGVSDEVRR